MQLMPPIPLKIMYGNLKLVLHCSYSYIANEFHGVAIMKLVAPPKKTVPCSSCAIKEIRIKQTHKTDSFTA
jgi:hypothetical protein